jgi:hypothetical protein
LVGRFGEGQPRHAADDKYLHITEDIMDTIKESSTVEKLEAEREIIRQSLDEITADFGSALRDAGLNYPLFLTVPNSGDALAGFATPVDPSDDDVSHMGVILCQIIGKKLGGILLRSRDLPCKAVNVGLSADLTAADMSADV